MSRIDPDVDQVQQQIDDRNALLRNVTGERAAEIRRSIEALEADRRAATGQAAQ